MSGNNNTKRTATMPLLTKILIPVFITGAIAGIYFVKNKDNLTENAETSIEASETEITPEAHESPGFELEVTEAIDLEQLKTYGLPIIIDFGADSCVPCKEMAPVLKKLNDTLQGKAIILFVDVWKYQDLAMDYPIRVIPTQVLIDSEGMPFTPNDDLDIPLMFYSTKDTNEHIFTTHEGGMTEEIMLEILAEMGLD